jgi:hypothetical protein
MLQSPPGPSCQSCSMPLSRPEDFGTDRSGSRVEDYCHFCYRDGAFLQPGIAMEQMITFCAGIMGRQGIMPEAEARALLAETLPRLKRWQKPSPSAAVEGASCTIGRADPPGCAVPAHQ